MNKTTIFIGIALILAALLGVATLMYFNPQKNIVTNIFGTQREIVSKDLTSNSLQWNGVNLIDRTVNYPNGSCSATWNNMTTYFPQCDIKTYNRINITQDWTFTTNRSASVAFAYDGQLESGAMYWYHNISYQYDKYSLQEQYISNYQVDNVTSSINMGTPNSSCQIGNRNNSQMYFVTRNISDSIKSVYYCFSSLTAINSTSYLISGNASIPITTPTTGYKLDWELINPLVEDITSTMPHEVTNTKSNNWSLYLVQNVSAGTYNVRWVYTPKDKNRTGKFHVISWANNKGFAQSYSDNDYLYQDPSWSTTDCNGIGGTISIAGNYCVHTFTNNGNFSANSTLNASVLVVAGGGGAGAVIGGPGGAGGLLYNNTGYNITDNTNYSVIIGVGGIGTYGAVTNNGSNSSFGSIVARGGGGGGCGGAGSCVPATEVGQPGGSGGGGGTNGGGPYVGGVGTPGQGYGGGSTAGAPSYGTGGGGGASQNGSNGLTTVGGSGGNGTLINITGTPQYYAGGGGGTTFSSSPGQFGYGGLGGGGNGSRFGANNCTDGMPNTGGGGGARSENIGSQGGCSGGSGVVIVSYLAGSQGGGDTNYPQFSNIQLSPPNGTAIKSTTLNFNVTITSTNGTAGFQIDSTNYTLSNATATLFNNITASLNYGNHQYYAWAYGNGTSTLFNTTALANYTLLNPYPQLILTARNPIDISTINLVGQDEVINYNITTNAVLNTTTVRIYVKTNSTTQNKILFVNGTTRPSNDANGFYLDSTLPTNSSAVNWTFSLDDNEIYPGTFNINQETMEYTVHSIFTGNANGGAAIALQNVSNLTQYNIFEIMTNRTGTLNPLTVYYCNSTYSAGTPSTNINCLSLGTLSATSGFNHTESNNSAHQAFPFAVINGSVGTVKVTAYSTFLAMGNTWNYYYITNQSRVGAAQTSSNGGGSWTNQTYTFDAHLHQYTGNETFYWYVSANNTLGDNNVSVVGSDLLNLGGIPPEAPVITSPNSSVTLFKGNINITYTSAVSPNGYNISNYNISLFNSDFSFNKVINAINYNNLSYNWNTVGTADGVYIIGVNANDSNNQLSSFGFSANFTIDNTAPAYSNPVAPTNNTPYVSGAAYPFNITFTDANGMGTVKLNFNGANYTATNISSTYLASVSDLGAGTYSYYWIGNDSVGNQNVTTTYSYTVAKATGSIFTYLNNARANLSVSNSTSVNLTTILNAGTGTINLYVNNVLYNTGNSALQNITTFPTPNNYTIVGNYSGNANYTSASESWTLTVGNIGANSVTTLTATPASPITYGTASNFSCSNDLGLAMDLFIWSGANYCYQESANVSTACGGLATGDYSIPNWDTTPYNLIDGDWSTRGIDGLFTGTRAIINYTKPINALNTSIWEIKNTNGIFNESIPFDCWNYSNTKITFSVQSSGNTWSCLSSTGWITIYSGANLGMYEEAMLWDRAVNKTNEMNSLIVRGAGTYTVNCISYTSGVINGSSAQSNYVINKAQPSIPISISPSNSITYGTASNASGICQSPLSCSMTENGNSISNGISQILIPGIYNYTLQTSGNENYTSAINSTVLTVSKATTTATLLLNDTAGNLTLTYPQQVNASASCMNATLTLYRNGTDITVSNNVFQSLSSGYYNFTAICEGNENYSTSSVTRFVTFNKATPIVTLVISPSSLIVNGTQSNVSCSADSGGAITLTRNGVSVSNPDIQTLGVNTYGYVCSVASTSNYSSGSTSSNLIVTNQTITTSGSINFTTSVTPFAYFAPTQNASCNVSKMIDNNFSTSQAAIHIGLGGRSCQVYANYSTYKATGNIANIKVDGFSCPSNTLSYYNYTSKSFKDIMITCNSSIQQINIPNDGVNNNVIAVSLISTESAFSTSGTWYDFNLTTPGVYPQSPSFFVPYHFLTSAYMNLSSTNTTNVNVSLLDRQIFYFSGLFNQSNNRTLDFASILNSYLISCSFVNGFCSVPILFNSNSSGTLTFSDIQFSNTGFILNSQSANTTTYETESQSFTANLSFDAYNFRNIYAYLSYDGILYRATVVNTSNQIIVNRTIDVPVGTGNKTWFFLVNGTNSNFILGSQSANNNNQTVIASNISICGSAPYNIPYLNFTFKNETVGAESVSSTFSSTFTYWLSNPLVNKTYTYANGGEQFSYSFCFSPQNRSVYTSYSGTYSNSYSPLRSFSNSSILLTNSSTNQILRLLPNSIGLYVSFIVQTFPATRLSGAVVSISRTSDGAFITSSSTDDSGIAAFWLDPTTSYTIRVTKSGYDDYSTVITPSQSAYTLTLTVSSTSGGGSGTPTPNPVDTININIAPIDNILVNGTIYTFKFKISSSKGRLDSYGFYLTNKSGDSLSFSNVGSNPNGETLTQAISTDDQSYIIMNFYYIIGNNYTNGTRVWVVTNSDGTDTSIKTFADDLKGYLNSSTGLFGLNSNTSSGSFGLAIIIFLIVFVFTGVMSYKFGLSGTTALSFILFSGVLFFDVAMNLIPNPINAVPHFPTVFMAVILVIAYIRESIT